MPTTGQGHREDRVDLLVPSRYECLQLIRQSVTELCRRAGLTEGETAQLEMAVDEACANVIEHSYGGECDAAEGAGLRVSVVPYPDRIVVEICDRGEGFDFHACPVVDPARFAREGSGRGLGMHIITEFVDDVSYARDTGSGNRLRLTKRLGVRPA